MVFLLESEKITIRKVLYFNCWKLKNIYILPDKSLIGYWEDNTKWRAATSMTPQNLIPTARFLLSSSLICWIAIIRLKKRIKICLIERIYEIRKNKSPDSLVVFHGWNPSKEHTEVVDHTTVFEMQVNMIKILATMAFHQ